MMMEKIKDHLPHLNASRFLSLIESKRKNDYFTFDDQNSDFNSDTINYSHFISGTDQSIFRKKLYMFIRNEKG